MKNVMQMSDEDIDEMKDQVEAENSRLGGDEDADAGGDDNF